MFVQAIEGRVADADGLRRQLERWMSELRPGASGFLGSTGGLTDGGDAMVFARFETSSDASANNERPEQGQWWEETEKCFEGEVRFTDSEEVDSFLAGGSNDAGFVQVMKGSGWIAIGSTPSTSSSKRTPPRSVPTCSVGSGCGPDPTPTPR